MSMLSVTRRSRPAATAPEPVAARQPVAGRRTLADLARGERATVAEVRGDADPAVCRRLLDLGFVPGTEVCVLRRAPLADPVVFRVAGYDIALRHAQARCIAGRHGTVRPR